MTMDMMETRTEVSDDSISGVGIRLLQPMNGPRVNVDTVLLAGFSKVRRGERVCELGCAHGAISLILAKRKDISVTGLDIQEKLIDMAVENAELNDLSRRISFLHGDLREIQGILPAQGFDVVVANPPYGDPVRHRTGSRSEKVLARHGVTCSVDDIADACRYLLGDRGRAYFVFAAERLVDFLYALRSRGMEPKAIRPVYPREGKDASVFLVKALKSASPGIRFLPALDINGEDGDYTEDLMKFYSPEGSPCP